MSPVEDALRRAIRDLQELGVDFALVGGLAVSIRTEPRFTRDVDCAVSVTDDVGAERVVSRLLSRGYRASAQVEQSTARRLATMRLAGPADRDAVVDLLFASSGIEPEIVRDAESLEVLPGLRCRVARVGHLLAIKALARDDERRPQDKADLLALLQVATRSDIELARRSARLIAERGFARDRSDLPGDVEKFISQHRAP